MAESPNSTKYIVLIGDGMADYPIDELGGKTPLEVSETPNMDRIAACNIGLARTIPDGMEAGSDIANLSLLGYDPKIYHTGRAPLEASSMGVELKPDEVAFRMNLVTLDWKSENEINMVSHSSGDITTEEAKQVVNDLKPKIEKPGIKIHPGVAYRHLLVWDKGPENEVTIPPHDVLDQNMAQYLNSVKENKIPDVIRLSWDILKEHPVNIGRRAEHKKDANSIWLWGQGRAPRIPGFIERFGLRGGVISAVDLLKGIGIYAGFKPIFVEGATGYLDTNYYGKAEEALKGLKYLDFLFLHVEAPDEAGHSGDVQEKIEAIELFDKKVVKTVLSGMEEFENYKVMVASDHYTPISKKTHTAEPTPFAWASKEEMNSVPKGPGFSEKSASESGLFFDQGHDLMPAFLGLV